jgi:dUTP pyrophosphatase
MKLFIKAHNTTALEFYHNHGHFHDGDAGLDLYVLEDLHFDPGETKAIK